KMGDNCSELSERIAALSGQIANLKILTEAQVRQIANSVVDQRLPPKITEIENKLLGVETVATGAQSTAGRALAKAGSFEATLAQMNSAIAEALRTAKVAVNTADLASGLSHQAKAESGIASSKAVSAVSSAAAATKEAADATNAVGGLRGIVNGIGAKVDGFGRAIGALESKVAGAVQAAANAVGISNEALAATGRLFGRIAEIFQIIGTLATLIEQLATLNVLGGRIDAVERAVELLGASVSGILGKLLSLQNRIGGVEGQLPAIKAIAVDARLIGEAAGRAAGSAQVTAARAQGTADTAIGNAKQAQITADGAVRNAATANDNATTAFKKAEESQSIGEQAKRVAGDALNKAGIALTTALTAIALYQGIKSLRGLQGIPGIPGRQGDRGERGFTGQPGRDGVNANTIVINVPGQQGAPGRPGRDGRNGFPGRQGDRGNQGFPGRDGRDGRDGIDVNPAEAASLRALIIQQHTQTRANSTAQHGQTRVTILTPIIAALAPILALLKQIYDIVSKAAGAAQLALLQIINNKLGNQVIGGIGGLITRVAENTYLEKALSVLTFAATMHNALMLSNNLGQTLISIIDQVTGFLLPKGIDGTPINFSESLGKVVKLVIESAIGEENYKELSEDWAKANRIYQATSNVFNQVTQLGGLITTGLEVIGGNVGKIGNALRKGGVLLENAYNYMNPQPNLQGKFFSFMNTANEKLSSIAAVVAIPIAFKEVLGGISSSSADLKREISQTDPKDEHGNPIKDKDGNIIHYKPGIEVPIPIVEQAKGEQSKADSTNFLQLVLDDIFDGGD
ncbi:MAG: hypothetical protein V7L02_18610, partial [Nostoc sp.]